MRIGVIGCGNIFDKAYAPGSAVYATPFAALADLDRAKAAEMAKKHGIPRVLSVEALLADPDIDCVLNLTIPAAHYDIQARAIAAGKHVYSEKPLDLESGRMAQVLAQAQARGLLVGCAPDTFLGSGHQRCRELIDQGAIGRVLSGIVCMACGGHESWHPNPEFYYQVGGGPVLDMGPYYLTALVNLLGPVRRVSSSAKIGFAQRTITSQPKHGTTIPVSVPTHVSGQVEFVSGALITLIMSFDVRTHPVPMFELYGSEGTLVVPDPNSFGDNENYAVRLWNQHNQGEIQSVKEPFGQRGLGLADMIRAQQEGRPPRASGRLAAHVLEVLLALNQGAGCWINIASQVQRPDPL